LVDFSALCPTDSYDKALEILKSEFGPKFDSYSTDDLALYRSDMTEFTARNSVSDIIRADNFDYPHEFRVRPKFIQVLENEQRLAVKLTSSAHLTAFVQAKGALGLVKIIDGYSIDMTFESLTEDIYSFKEVKIQYSMEGISEEEVVTQTFKFQSEVSLFLETNRLIGFYLPGTSEVLNLIHQLQNPHVVLHVKKAYKEVSVQLNGGHTDIFKFDNESQFAEFLSERNATGLRVGDSEEDCTDFNSSREGLRYKLVTKKTISVIHQVRKDEQCSKITFRTNMELQAFLRNGGYIGLFDDTKDIIVCRLDDLVNNRSYHCVCRG
jgi:hypothetical protein